MDSNDKTSDETKIKQIQKKINTPNTDPFNTESELLQPQQTEHERRERQKLNEQRIMRKNN